ncbi:hypothetical protein [Pseudobutyrivibrio xylanivorans]|uniref:Uncharacterized protein n=1 Tax=Pseudobutyrivibrio xylanivorans TaxID=185007 RepID=A0A5P6VS09_PSEXY|nr:hypothetical protein [Pseudobutyrivibrio xylanivorans]QFJ55202.1 hypothetical protein FXF36_10175 [Pseudobutyrivibrio xylanivorans]
MGFNPADLFKVRSAAETFNSNHPKLLPFFNAVKGRAMTPGSVIEIAVTDSTGERIETNLRIQESDLELIRLLTEMGMKG